MIENAIKYSSDKVTIKINAVSTSDGCQIIVKDNGNGIAADDINRIFNRFYRGKASASDIPGMGLGLAYVKLLTDAHGGKNIIMRRSVSRMVCATSKPFISGIFMSRSIKSGWTSKILRVDDDLKNSMLLKRFIEAEGYEVVYASNGKVGLELYRDVHPDLILLDINMPEMNGFEVAQRVRFAFICQ